MSLFHPKGLYIDLSWFVKPLSFLPYSKRQGYVFGLAIVHDRVMCLVLIDSIYKDTANKPMYLDISLRPLTVTCTEV